MMPIAPLMIEHRLIERMIKVMRSEADQIGVAGRVRPEFIDQAVDFIRMYADRCHHGKEEDILFERLSRVAMSDQYREMMQELKEEHVRARETTARLVKAKQRYVSGDGEALSAVSTVMKGACRFLSGTHRKRR